MRTALCSRRRCLPGIAGAILLCVASAHSHVHWTQLNHPDATALGIYQINENGGPLAELLPHPGMDDQRALVPVPTSATSLLAVADTPGTLFGPSALSLSGPMAAETTETMTGLDGDLTIECWFKWLPTMSSSSLTLGLRSGAKLQITRDIANPIADRLGAAGTHGSFISANGFTNWSAVGEEEASLGEWRHIALAIHSTGIHYEPGAAHDVYSTGSIGRIYLNGHPVGFAPHTFPVEGLKVHAASKLELRVPAGGGVLVDEIAVWSRDWTDNGTRPNPFGNGRGTPASSVARWELYE